MAVATSIGLSYSERRRDRPWLKVRRLLLAITRIRDETV
jgi:hypothetical protein